MKLIAVVVLEAGRVTQMGTMDELVAAPKTDFVRAFTQARSGA